MTEDDRPRDLDAEQAVLGAMLLGTATTDPHPVLVASTTLTAGDFYRPIHAELFTLLTELWEAGQPTDPVNVAAVLHARQALLRLGGAPYLHDLIAAVPTVANVGYYAEIVADCAVRSRLIDAAVRVRQLATTGGRDDTPDMLERARATVEAATIARGVGDEDDGAWMDSAVDAEIASWSQPKRAGLPTPFIDLNDVCGGFKPGQLVIVAARPGVGKSAVACDVVRTASKHDVTSLVVSLEMPRGEFVRRMLAAEAKARVTAMERGHLDAEEMARVQRHAVTVRKWPVRIEDRHEMSMARIAAKARQVQASESGLGVVIVDYIQLMTPSDPRMPRHEQVGSFSRGLKGLAKELEVPVIALAQLNRGPESRDDKMPRLSDLRESGSLENDCDMAILIHRPDAHDKQTERAGEADLILAKHRAGPTATIPVAHQLHYGRFSDLAHG